MASTSATQHFEPLATTRSVAQRFSAADLALGAIIIATAFAWIQGLSESGWANAYYSAAAQAGANSWSAFFFGSFDSAGAITVDKPPASLWPMALSVKLFGLSSWSILIPQALMGVATVILVAVCVRIATGNAWAANLAAVAMATTPVAALMFRFNNPDALLLLLLTGAVTATITAIARPERSTRWLVLAGVLIGFGFLTKMLQAFLVLPALGLGWLIFGHGTIKKRLAGIAAAGLAIVVSAGWWIAIVELWPADTRPWIGGSPSNSILELTLGYNGIGRISGEQPGSVGGQGGWGETGVWRMLNTTMGDQASWLAFAAFTAIAATMWFTRRDSEARILRAATVITGVWLAVTWIVFSFMAGIFHEYYTVALAAPIAIAVGLGCHVLWSKRDHSAVRVTAGFAVALTSTWSFVLLARSSDFMPPLRWIVIIAGVFCAGLIVLWPLLSRRVVTICAVATCLVVLAGPAAFSAATVAVGHSGSIVTAGPPSGVGGPGAPGAGFGGGAGGGLLNGSSPGAELTEMLAVSADSHRWVAAAVGANSAAGYQLAAQAPVMAIGGFNGTDPSPTLEEFQAYVADGQIGYFISAGRGGGPGAADNQEITAWVEENFTSETIDGVTVWDLSDGIR